VPDVAPFDGIRYDPAVVDLSTAPPYDVISPAERAALEAASPYNIVRLILGAVDGEDGKYSRVTSLLQEWLSAGVLVRDGSPTMTIYEETIVAGGSSRHQRGVLAAVEMGADILPHERTMAPVVEDRLAVIRAARANLSPVFCVYWTAESAAADAIERAASAKPCLDFVTEDGTSHRAWTVDDGAVFEAVAKGLAAARVVIADGHHRYRTAEAYRDERRAADGPGPWDRMLLYLVDAERDSPALLPIHRLVEQVPLANAIRAMEPAFQFEQVPGVSAGELAEKVAGQRTTGRCYGFLGPKAAWIATLRDESAADIEGEHSQAWRDLDVTVLHRLIFERLLGGPAVNYVHHPAEAAGALTRGEASFAVLLAPTPLQAVREVAEAHDSMPPKSTFFVPKPRSGIVIRPLDG
jgi:uncharacterized protein (DUF1015 family)